MTCVTPSAVSRQCPSKDLADRRVLRAANRTATPASWECSKLVRWPWSIIVEIFQGWGTTRLGWVERVMRLSFGFRDAGAKEARREEASPRISALLDQSMDSIDQVRLEHPEHLARFRADPSLRPDLNRPAIGPWIPANQANQHPTQNYPSSAAPSRTTPCQEAGGTGQPLDRRATAACPRCLATQRPVGQGLRTPDSRDALSVSSWRG